MTNTRHRAREIALQILYQHELNHHSAVGGAKGPIVIAPLVGGSTGSSNLPQAGIGDLKKYFEHFKVSEALREFIGVLVAGTTSQTQVIDETLEKHASNWKVSRMSFVDRCLLRMAAYELLNLRETPPSVVINEAIELGKQFGTSDTPAFINGILDSIKNSLDPAKTS